MSDTPDFLNACVERYSHHCTGAWRGSDGCRFYAPFRKGAPKGANCLYCLQGGYGLLCLNKKAIEACTVREPRIDLAQAWEARLAWLPEDAQDADPDQIVKEAQDV